MILNLHERLLLLRLRLSHRQLRQYRAVIDGVHRSDDEIDIAAQLGGFKLAKRSVVNDLPTLFDQLNARSARNVRAVVYGHRTYHRTVILAAALHRAGVAPHRYEASMTAGRATLSEMRPT